MIKYASVETTSDFDFILVNYFFKSVSSTKCTFSVNKFAFIYLYLYFEQNELTCIDWDTQHNSK